MAGGNDVNASVASTQLANGMDPALDAGQDPEMQRRRQQYRAEQEKRRSTVPGNGTGVHINGADAKPAPIVQDWDELKDALNEIEKDAFPPGSNPTPEELQSLRTQSANMLGKLHGTQRGTAFSNAMRRLTNDWSMGFANYAEAHTQFSVSGAEAEAFIEGADETAAATNPVADKIGEAGAFLIGMTNGSTEARAANAVRKWIFRRKPKPPKTQPGNNGVQGRKPEKKEGDQQDPAKKGEPVVVATGEYVESWDDFFLDGTIPLTFTRCYGAHWETIGPCGRNRTTIIDTTFSVTPENELLFRDEQGRCVTFERPFNLSPSLNDKYRHLTLRAPWLKQLTLENGRLTHFYSQGKDELYRLIKIEDRDANSLTVERDNSDLVVKIKHSDGYVLHFENDGSGFRRSITLEYGDNRHLLARYEYDNGSNLLSADCETSFSINYEYDDLGRLVEWKDHSSRSRTRFEYDAHNRVVRTETSGSWNNDTFEYDHEKRVSIYRPGGSEAFEKVHYDEDRNVLWEENALGETTRFEYVDGYRTAVTDPEGITQRFEYDPFGNISSFTDGEGRITLYRWGTRGELDMVVDNAGNSYANDYDDFGHLISATDPEGNITRFEWNNAGRLTRTLYPDASDERRAYDQGHRLIEVISPNGSRTEIGRDALGRITFVIDPEGRETNYEYDYIKGKSLYEPTKISRPDGTTVQHAFDQEGKISAFTDGAGNTTRYHHGAFDLLTSITDPMGNKLSVDYDVRGQVSAVTNARGFTYTYDRDLAGRIVAETDFENRRTEYKLDRAGRTIRRIAPDKTERHISYDLSHRIVTISSYELLDDGDLNPIPEEVEKFSYDDRGLVVHAANSSNEVIFERDRIGRVVAESQNHRRLSFAYDNRGRRVGRSIGFAAGWNPNGKEARGFQGFTIEDIEAGRLLTPPTFESVSAPIADCEVRYTYDQIGFLSELTIAGNRPASDAEHLSFQRDALGREISRENGCGFSLRQRFDRVGQLTQQTVAGFVEPAIGSIRINATAPLHVLEQRPNLETVESTRSVPRQIGYGRHFEYDKSNSPVCIADDLWGGSRFAYDANSQVSQADHGISINKSDANKEGAILSAPLAFPSIGVGEETREVERFFYDATQNIEATETALAGEPFGRTPTQWITVSGGSVKAARGPTGERIFLTHDECGRVIERRIEFRGFRPKITRFTWNALNRLVGCVNSDGERWAYSYDPFGRRTEKRIVRRLSNAPGDGISIRSGPDQRFIWDGDTIAEQIPIRNGTLEMGRRVIWHYEPDTFRPLARETAEGQVSYIVTDHLGTPRECVSSSGSLEWATQYRLWGGIRQQWQVPKRVATGYDIGAPRVVSDDSDESDPDFCPIRFEGQWEDNETGLYYNHFRTYDPSTAAYMSPDPFGLEGGSRPGAYVSFPTIFTDPLGLQGRQPYQYNSFFDYNLKPSQYTLSDAVQFNRANKGLINQMTNDPNFRRDMLGRYPELKNWMENPKMSGSPPGLTWHHSDTPGKLELVDRNDHRKVFGTYHPDGKGGRCKWGGGKAGRDGKL